MATRIENGKVIELTAAEVLADEVSWAATNNAKIDEENANGWKRRRMEAYLSLGTLADQIDIIQKQFVSMVDRGEVTMVAETLVWLDAIQAIKYAYPKPDPSSGETRPGETPAPEANNENLG